jgi:hypothetical protein
LTLRPFASFDRVETLVNLAYVKLLIEQIANPSLEPKESDQALSVVVKIRPIDRDYLASVQMFEPHSYGVLFVFDLVTACVNIVAVRDLLANGFAISHDSVTSRFCAAHYCAFDSLYMASKLAECKLLPKINLAHCRCGFLATHVLPAIYGVSLAKPQVMAGMQNWGVANCRADPHI